MQKNYECTTKTKTEAIVFKVNMVTNIVSISCITII